MTTNPQTAVARYRKLPVEIEAVQLAGDSLRQAIHFVPLEQFGGGGVIPDDGRYFVDIKTLEGVMRAMEGDWIIKGVQGEFYPCRDDIFRATYEPASVPSAPADQAADLRARIVAAIRTAPFKELRTVDYPNGPLQITANVDDLADAVLRAAVPSAPVDRAAVLRDFLWRLEQSAGDAAAEKFLDDNPELRRMADEAAAIASCPGYETSPSPCRCPCYGCKHHCGAHDPSRMADEEQDDDTVHACPGRWGGPNCRCFDADEEQQPETQADDDLPARLEAVLTKRFTELGNPFSRMSRHEKGPDGWPAAHPVGPHHVAEVLRELLATDEPAAVAQPGKECAASISGNCLAEAHSETGCATEDGECIHAGQPGKEA